MTISENIQKGLRKHRKTVGGRQGVKGFWRQIALGDEWECRF